MPQHSFTPETHQGRPSVKVRLKICQKTSNAVNITAAAGQMPTHMLPIAPLQPRRLKVYLLDMSCAGCEHALLDAPMPQAL